MTQSKQIILKKGLANSKKDTDTSQGVEKNSLSGIFHHYQIAFCLTYDFTDSL